MDPDSMIKTITENPIAAGMVSAAVAAVVGFFKPVVRAGRAAVIRRIDRAWANTDGSHDERVQQTTDSLRAQTLVPLPRSFVEQRVRKRTPTTS